METMVMMRGGGKRECNIDNDDNDNPDDSDDYYSNNN